jgi:cytochrome c oxidase accessory protein FixG
MSTHLTRSTTASESSEQAIRLFVSEDKIYPRAVTGRFARWRWLMVWLTQLVFYGAPWLQWAERPAVLFDLEARRFYLFSLVLYPQDFIFLAVLLVISALSLFLVTAVAGRVWCGYTCPQTVYSEIFMWIERLVEGDRSRRLKLDASPWGWHKISRKGAKQLLWIAVALWTGISFVGYFTPIRDLIGQIASWDLGSWQTFWIGFYALATYGNAGFLREQVCKYMCPYARFQSAMFDKDTLIVSYDERRGEPRGGRSRSADPKALGLGSCIDCSLCVQVCPTGIDIRKGLQYECIGCAACADVCDSVMDKMQYPRGLIRYDTSAGMSAQTSQAGVRRMHLLRPRVLIYTTIWLAIVIAWMSALAMRSPLKVDVIRDRGALARIVERGRIENVYRLQLMNASSQDLAVRVRAQGIEGLEITGQTEMNLPAAQAAWVVVRVRMPYGALPAGSHPMQFVVDSPQQAVMVAEASKFYVPR